MVNISKLPPLKTEGIRWEVRREEIKKILSLEEYGEFPPSLPPRVEVVRKDAIAYAGKAVEEELIFTFENNGKSFSFPAHLLYPNDGKQHPFFVFINFEAQVPNKRYPAEEIIDNGFGVLSFCHNDISIDKNEFGTGLERLFLEGERGATCFGKITLWAYAMSRALDYLLERNLAKKNKIAAVGHSRLGKTALWAGANDKRFAFVISNDSGCSGAALARGTTGETVKNIVDRFPYWFCPNYFRFAGAEEEMPFDQHFLLALVAPRTLIVGAADLDTWADTLNQYLAVKAALPAFELYQKGGGFEDETPQTGKKYGKDGAFFRERKGTHYLSREDWNYYMEVIKRD